MHSLPSVKNIEAFQAWRCRSVAMPAGGARHRAQPWLAAPRSASVLDRHQSRGRARRPADPEDLSAAAARISSCRNVPRCRSFADGSACRFRKSCSKASATNGRISSSRGCRASWARRPGRPCRRTRRSACSAQIGETIAEVQRVPVGELVRSRAALGRHSSRGQIEGCRARHERLGLPQKYLDGLDDLLRDAAALIPLDAPPVILTGEYIPENFLLSRESGSWRLAGLIDFGDVMTGWGEYDLLGPERLHGGGNAAPGRKACSTGSDIRQATSRPR